MMMTDILNVVCPVCDARIGERCVTASGAPAKSPHKGRKDLAAKLKKPQRKASPKKVAKSKVDLSKVDPRVRQRPLTQTVMKQEPVQPDPLNLVNHIALIVDASVSMYNVIDRARTVFNEQLNNIRKNAAKSGQKTLISVYKFGSHVEPLQLHASPETINQLTRQTYDAEMNSTRLRDAVGIAISDFRTIREINDVNHSFLVITITDGDENDSRRFNTASIQNMIAQAHSTDRWTFAFLVPPRHSRLITKNFGAYAGNIIEWETTNRGVVQAGTQIASGLNTFFDSRAKGKKSTQTFFANLDKVDDVDLASCDDISSNFFRWKVKGNCPIRDFVNQMIDEKPAVADKINGFQQGNGYYELTKSELVQEYKDFIIMDKQTGAIFGGDQARALAGIPLGARLRVRPGQFGNFTLFIMSASVNRKLIDGTTFLYRHTR